MRTNQDAPSSQHDLRERRVPAGATNAEGMTGDVDRRGLQLALSDALADILRAEASEATKAARH